jgi:acetyl esterase/lipase
MDMPRAFGAEVTDLPVGVKKETIVYKRVGELQIKADVYHFTDEKVRPVVVFLHGGALMMGNREDEPELPLVRKEMLANGYVLVSFDYRLAPQTKLPGIIADIEDGFRWLRREGPKKFHIDRARVAVVGDSAGGYLTLVTGYRVRPRPRVLVVLFGYGELITDWYSTPSHHPSHNERKITEAEAWKTVQGPEVSDDSRRKDGFTFYTYCRQTGQWPNMVSGWDPHREAKKFFPFMPVKNVSAKYPPTALIHGTADTDVPFEQSQMMAQEFKKHGVPFQLHAIANAEHSLVDGNPKEIEEAYRKSF